MIDILLWFFVLMGVICTAAIIITIILIYLED